MNSMKSRKILLATGAVALAGAVFYYVAAVRGHAVAQPGLTEAPGLAGQPSSTLALTANDAAGPGPVPPGQMGLPFQGRGHPAPPPFEPEDPAVQKKLEKLGYFVPPELYTYDLASVRKLAAAGDAFALVHLGERYFFELRGMRRHPDFDPNIDYAKAARDSLREALARGNAHAAAMISEMYLVEKNSIEAVAWSLVAEGMGDDVSVEWFRRTKDWQQLSEEDKQRAQRLAQQHVAELSQLQASLKPASAAAIDTLRRDAVRKPSPAASREGLPPLPGLPGS